MSSYFEKFPKVFYLFGDEKSPVYFQKLSKYVDIIDQFKDEAGTYIDYEIPDNERADTLSHRIYGRSDYDWTFFIMNERLRESGWPLSLHEIYTEGFAAQMFPNYVAILSITTADSAISLANAYPIGTSVIIGDKPARVIKRNLELGEFTLSADSDIRMSTRLYDPDSDYPELSLVNTVYEYEGTHHYINDSDQYVDLFFSNDTVKVPITNLEHLINENQKTRKIRVLKKEAIGTLVGRLKALLEIE